ncbi:unnamed protein product [Nesidiocoris tenuis]|uniref:Nuclear receptor domain-containing protein n=1 Tax=Nesidiocoris tenuis TaxID=355587 RepID=A0A6H5GIK6_9HEMI|nr:unnamed protein product [Nesidiocoris tenuis]
MDGVGGWFAQSSKYRASLCVSSFDWDIEKSGMARKLKRKVEKKLLECGHVQREPQQCGTKCRLRETEALAFRPITEVVPGVPCRPQGEGRNYSGHVALVSQHLCTLTHGYSLPHPLEWRGTTLLSLFLYNIDGPDDLMETLKNNLEIFKPCSCCSQIISVLSWIHMCVKLFDRVIQFNTSGAQITQSTSIFCLRQHFEIPKDQGSGKRRICEPLIRPASHNFRSHTSDGADSPFIVESRLPFSSTTTIVGWQLEAETFEKDINSASLCPSRLTPNTAANTTAPPILRRSVSIGRPIYTTTTTTTIGYYYYEITILRPCMNQQCKVCNEPAAGFHFGAFTCEGCKVPIVFFFKFEFLREMVQS